MQYLEPTSDLPFFRASSHVDGYMEIIAGQVHRLSINPGPGPFYCRDWVASRLAHQGNVLSDPVLGILRSRDNHRS